MLEHRAWIIEAEKAAAEAAKAAHVHHERWKANWRRCRADCADCKRTDWGWTMCDEHTTLVHTSVPCMECGSLLHRPDVAGGLFLCPSCDLEHPQTLIDYIAAKALCGPEIENLKATVEYYQDELRKASEVAWPAP